MAPEFESRNGVPQCTLEHYETAFASRHRLPDVVSFWARRKPDAACLIAADSGRALSWRELDAGSAALARQLLAMGFRKGDCLAASLPFLLEHIVLEYACFRIGIIHTPLDLRLRAPEVIRSVSALEAKGYAFLGRTPAADFRDLARAVRANCPSVEHFIQFSAPEETIEGALSAAELASRASSLASRPDDGVLRRAEAAVGEHDGAQVIFTTGSTGLPKPALLSHRNITSQNLCLGTGFGFGEESRLLVNLPPSHVGGQAETLMTTLYFGGTAVVMRVFDPAASLRAIEEHKVDVVGQIPAMFNLEWRLSNYASYRLESLGKVIYGGQQVPRQFLERLALMAPKFGTGLGLTESAGFCTYTPLDGTVDDIAAGIGYDMPLYPMSIREPMREDGAAGAELPAGQTGHICFRGPQTFLGYMNDPESTARAISRDGYLYTGDLGFADAGGLHLAGRARWVIKPAGYQVFPGQVENHFCEMAREVAACGVVGVEHAVFSEGIVAFVEKKPEAALAIEDLKRHARSLPSYMRPLHYVILEPGQMPLNRAVKTDYVRLSEMAREEVARLRERRRWDR